MLASVFAADATAARVRAVQHRPPATNQSYTAGGYANRVSVPQGGTIDFHISTAVPSYGLEIVNLANPEAVVRTIAITGSIRRDCTGLPEVGCKWPVTTSFSVPASFPSGYYAARFPTLTGQRFIFFIVREDVPGSTSRTAVVASTHTFQAYNSYGGKSLYPSASPERSYRVSYDRPYFDNRGLGRYPRWDEPFLKWLTQERIPFEVLSDPDLEDPALLARYDVLVLVGHSEYWTAAARANVEAFVANGGRLAIFGGNTMWWQARLEQGGRTLVVYKSAAADPETGRNNAVVTTNFYAPPVLRPENLITGSSFRNGGYTNREQPTFGYTVTDAGHWAFAGTSAARGTPFGNIAAGLEVDGALYNCTMDGLAGEVDGSDGTPLNFRILATVPAAEGHGTIGIYTTPTGGAVFNAGTQDWVLGLTTDAIVTAMTRNVLQRFAAGRLPYEHVEPTGIRMRELFNCALDTTEARLVPGWRGDEGQVTTTARCAQEGPRGLELSGDDRIRITRDFAPTGNALDRVQARFQLNATATTAPADADLGLVTLQSRSGTTITRAARIDLDPATRRVRLALFNAANASTLRTAWVPLASGWNAVEVTWSGTGAPATLRVGNGNTITLENPTSGQKVSEVFLNFDDSRIDGYLCIDALTLQ